MRLCVARGGKGVTTIADLKELKPFHKVHFNYIEFWKDCNTILQ